MLEEMHGVNDGHFSSKIIIHKILDAKYWWPTMYKEFSNIVKLVTIFNRRGI
jgi:hypothetical protein